MKYLFILISVLSSIQLSLAQGKVHALQSADTRLIIAEDGKNMSLQTGDTRYSSLNAPYVVTLEVNGETLNGYYFSVNEVQESLVCTARLKSNHGTLFHIKDVFTPDTENHFRMDREVIIEKAGKEDAYFNSYFGLTLQRKTEIIDFEFFVPGIWYNNNQSLRPGALSSDYNDNYFYFREDRLPLPLVSAREKVSGLAISMIHLDANPETFYGENGVQRIVDERMQFGSLGFTETDSHSILFVFPGIEGEMTYVGRFPEGKSKGFAYRSHPVKTGVKHSYSLTFGFNQTKNFPNMVETVWKQAWDKYTPSIYKMDVKDAYEASIEVLDAYLLNLNGAPGWPFSIYLPNGVARAYNYQMGFIGFQISNGYFLLRKGLESNNQEYVRKASEVIDFWVNNSQMENGLIRPWADAYVDRGVTWRDYEAYMRVAAGGMEGMMGAWNIMKKHGNDRPEWLAYCKKYGDWLTRNQEEDGSFYLRYNWKTGKPTHDSKYTTTNIIRFLIELYSVTQDKRYLDTALKAGEFSYDFIHRDYLYVGGVIDNPNVKDRESGQMAIYAFLALYDVTGDEKWKEAAIQAARYTETFMFAYHVPMAINDTLTDFPKDKSIVGQTLIATGHSAIDNGLAFSSFQYYRLYLITGDSHFLEMARLIQNNTLSIMDLDGKLRYRHRGLLTECFNPQANRGHSVRQQLPWNQASILEPMHRFMNAFGEWDIDVIEQWPTEQRQEMIQRYARTQGLEKE
ncbi:glycoside hydrolase family 76 protein [uncultured Proteiniphilum sp.]|uniref:glycoside hydrolase family 76 protein n=1 Tax=uncultured Proteiniphilum sp. TaxID=497637 RepID=UPI00262D3034|nr:glycoside hydrolase family 76 protein [uncultured Proteiniphilum sp.]